MPAHAFANRAIDIYMYCNLLLLRRPLLRAAQRAKHTQHHLLMNILRQNAGTAFGRKHDFRSITSMAEYRAKVPVHTYDQLEPYIKEQQTGSPALTQQPPVYYARTSGTTGASKDIPLTRHGLAQVKHAQKHLALSLWRHTGFFKGAILGFAGPATEGHLQNGTPFGSASGSTYRSLPPILARKFVPPPSAFSIRDMAAKYQIYALAALATDDITGVATANPSSLLKVLSVVRADAPQLLSALLSQPGPSLLPQVAKAAGEIAGRGNPSHIRTLLDKLASGHELQPADLWPRLSAVATWTGGSCGIALAQLRPQLPKSVKIVEFGYGASEFMGAANIDANRNLCLPLLTHHVYEFVRRGEWEAGQPQFLGLHEIQPGDDYYIFVTTRSGLYRYHINDIIRAEPGVGSCPALRFLHKGRGITNITGEKLSEHQLITAMAQTLAEQALSATSYIALADEEASCYVLYLECPDRVAAADFTARLDTGLRALNSEYDDKRASGRLGPVRIKHLSDGAGEQIKQETVARGVREAQYKPVLLDYARNWTATLRPLTRAGAPI